MLPRMFSRTLGTQLRNGHCFSLFVRNQAKNFLPIRTNLNGIKNIRFLHQQCRESLCKKRPKKKVILVFLVGHARYSETVAYLRETACRLFTLLLRQCEVHIGLKIRSFLHLHSFYSRIWGEEMTAKMFGGLRKALVSRTKLMLCSALPMAVVDWQKHSIPDEKLDNAINEYTSVHELCSATLYCTHCLERKIVDTQIETIDYCKCKGTLNYTDSSCVYESWQPFLERKNTIVWRKEHEQHKNTFCYKVYGTYDDVSANSFAEVQLNTLNRTKWDTTALQLTVVGSDPTSMTDLLYWKVKFPKFFADRDYIYKRRFRVNENRKEIIIVGEAMHHDQYPKIPGIHRVEDYWAIMVIRADNDFHVPGMSYTLTYFDNPGTTLPTAITNLIASKSFPDFLCNVHRAAYQLQKKWDEGEDIYVTLPDRLRYRKKLLSAAFKDEKPTLEKKSTHNMEVQSVINGLKELLKEVSRNDDFQDNAKIPISFRNAVIDLLEASEVIGPDLNRDTFLVKKVQELVVQLVSEDQSVFVKKLLQLAEKTVKVLNECAAKKKESLRVMREMEKRHNYRLYDQNAQHLLAKFFNTLNETLQADRDLRTGKLLAKPVKSDDMLKPQKCEYSVQNTKHIEVCPCCTKPYDNSLNKPTKKDLDYLQCPNCYCNMLPFSPYYSIRYFINSMTIHRSILRNDINSNRIVDRSYAWYSSPFFSTWKLILWLFIPWCRYI